MNGRLALSGAFTRPRILNPLLHDNYDERLDPGNTSNSASHSKMEREVKNLKAENTKLKSELNETCMALKQLISESSHEKFDERRINLLKLQIIQLERQITVLNNAVGCRQEALWEVENAMTWLADKLRSYIAADVKGPMVPIARSDLTSMTEVSESARIKLFKTLENTGKDALGKELLFLNPFLGGKYRQGESLTLLDISMHRMDYINLRHVAQLESKLCQVYKELMGVHEQIQNMKPKHLFAGHKSCVERDRTETALLKTCVMVKDVADDLMALSLLCPSSPWPVLKRPIIKEVSAERVITALPTMPRGKHEEVTRIIEACMRTCNYRQFLLMKEMAVLKEELAFHRSVYDLQMQYTQSLFDAVRKGYSEFEVSAKSFICEPLKDILDAYKQLKKSVSEDAFREFLIIMKANEEQLMSVVETLSSNGFESGDNGPMALSKFGEDFMNKINSLVRDCQNKRDAAMSIHREVKEEQTKKDLELQHVIEDLENKYKKIWTPAGAALYSDGEALLVKKAASRGRDREHTKVTSGKSTENGQPGEMSDLKDDEINLQTRQHRDDLVILRSLLNDKDDESCKLRTESCQMYRTSVRKKWNSDCSLSEQDTNNTKISDSEKTNEIRQKPGRDWINDFSNQPNQNELPSSTKQLLGGNSDVRTTCQDSVQKPPSEVRENEHKVKKQASYEPKLSVASRTLKLRRPGSLSKTVTKASEGISATSAKGSSNDAGMIKFGT